MRTTSPESFIRQKKAIFVEVAGTEERGSMSVINQSDIEHIDEALRKLDQSEKHEWFCGHPDRLHG